MDPKYEADFDRALSRCQAEWDNKEDESGDDDAEATEDDLTMLDEEDNSQD